MAEPSETASHLILSASTLDRDALRRSDDGLLPGLLADARTLVLHLRGERMPVDAPEEQIRLRYRAPSSSDDPARCSYLGMVRGAPVVALFDEPEPEPADAGTTDPDDLQRQRAREHRSLRALAPVLSVDDLGVATTAVAMANWIVTQRFCSRCGAPVALGHSGWVMRCAEGHSHFPRTDPAVIMSVTDPDDRLLLAQGARFVVPTGMSVLAGFLEPGESLEAAVRREVLEEVGLPVDEVRYVDNQPWPMPASLMVGFAARTSSTELRLEDDEIRHAQWFTRGELDAALASGELTVPPRLSIARHLIERWYGAVLPPQPGDVR
ncbi:NAD(+) diphosphatase [Yimella sp. cx-51]|uniref:NAD(+) diphosphatase n=1 Tax=Yimella sp. cx-51 TaxID=2770551 RepID=UPI00165DBD66|nr:NAD(+) diphosphatase [Yimella sp. cx-51]MBC9956069.1 NAD(+) diphosphatase [Yimella sp. cx-51]